MPTNPWDSNISTLFIKMILQAIKFTRNRLRTHLWYVPTFTINKTNDFNSLLTPVNDNSFNYSNSQKESALTPKKSTKKPHVTS